jgi:hypothetical protein
MTIDNKLNNYLRITGIKLMCLDQNPKETQNKIIQYTSSSNSVERQ